MLIAGIVTLVQVFTVGPVGGKLPIVMGTSSGFIGVCQSVAGVMGNGVVAYGAIMRHPLSAVFLKLYWEAS